MFRLASVVTLLLLIAVVALGLFEVSSVPPADDGGRAGDATYEFGDAKNWTQELRGTAQVEFFRSPAELRADVAANPRVVVHSLGGLDPDQHERLVARVGRSHHAERLAEAQSKAEGGDPRDYLAFLFEQYNFAKLRAVQSMLESREYVVLPSGGSLPPMPEDYGVLGFLNAVRVAGQRADVYFLIDFEQHPDCANARRTAEDFEAFQVDAEVQEFNTQLMAVRQDRIMASDMAIKRLGELDGTEGEADLQAMKEAQLPRNWQIDRNLWLVSRRILHRH